MSKPAFQETEVYIRIPEKGMDFVYTIRRGEEVIESGVVPPIDVPAPKPSVAMLRYLEAFPAGAFNDPECWSSPDAAQAFHSSLYGHSGY
jgi:hypothetical protein